MLHLLICCDLVVSATFRCVVFVIFTMAASVAVSPAVGGSATAAAGVAAAAAIAATTATTATAAAAASTDAVVTGAAAAASAAAAAATATVPATTTATAGAASHTATGGAGGGSSSASGTGGDDDDAPDELELLVSTLMSQIRASDFIERMTAEAVAEGRAPLFAAAAAPGADGAGTVAASAPAP